MFEPFPGNYVWNLSATSSFSSAPIMRGPIGAASFVAWHSCSSTVRSTRICAETASEVDGESKPALIAEWLNIWII